MTRSSGLERLVEIIQQAGEIRKMAQANLNAGAAGPLSASGPPALLPPGPQSHASGQQPAAARMIQGFIGYLARTFETLWDREVVGSIPLAPSDL
jgi:hypothetical protein